MSTANTTIKRLFIIVAFFILLFGGLAVYTTFQYRTANKSLQIEQEKNMVLEEKIKNLETQLKDCQ